MFFDDQDREDFLSVLGSVVRRYNVLCHAYCLIVIVSLGMIDPF
jgi:hypothetical protein